MAEPFIHRLRVRYSECDLQGVLFNANYLAYVDHTITELWRAAYGGYTVMLDRGADIVVAETNLRFLGAARFDEEVMIEATVTHLGTTSITTTFRFHRVVRGEGAARKDGGPEQRAIGELLLEGWIRHVWIDPQTRAKVPMPDWGREGLAPWYVPAPGAAPAPGPTDSG
jgi:acyl-CoA thioester hydrolase